MKPFSYETLQEFIDRTICNERRFTTRVDDIVAAAFCFFEASYVYAPFVSVKPPSDKDT